MKKQELVHARGDNLMIGKRLRQQHFEVFREVTCCAPAPRGCPGAFLVLAGHLDGFRFLLCMG